MTIEAIATIAAEPTEKTLTVITDLKDDELTDEKKEENKEDEPKVEEKETIEPAVTIGGEPMKKEEAAVPAAVEEKIVSPAKMDGSPIDKKRSSPEPQPGDAPETKKAALDDEVDDGEKPDDEAAADASGKEMETPAAECTKEGEE